MKGDPSGTALSKSILESLWLGPHSTILAASRAANSMFFWSLFVFRMNCLGAMSMHRRHVVMAYMLNVWAVDVNLFMVSMLRPKDIVLYSPVNGMSWGRSVIGKLCVTNRGQKILRTERIVEALTGRQRAAGHHKQERCSSPRQPGYRHETIPCIDIRTLSLIALGVRPPWFRPPGLFFNVGLTLLVSRILIGVAIVSGALPSAPSLYILQQQPVVLQQQQ